MRVLLSIRPEHVANILNGSKQFEFRRKLFRREVESVLIYCTRPVGRVVAEFSIDSVIENDPATVWALTHTGSGISKDYFDRYFEGRARAFAIKIGALTIYEEPLDPEEVIADFTPPQSYRYVPAYEPVLQHQLL